MTNEQKELMQRDAERIKLEAKNKKMERVFSIDWLTLNIKLNDVNNPIVRLENIYFIERPKGTNIFERCRDYYNKTDELIFTIVFRPFSSIIKPYFAQLQIANKWLYVGNLPKLVSSIFFHANFELVNISRVDFCVDQFYFPNSYHPQYFIQDLAKGKVSKKHKGKVVFWGRTADYYIDYNALNIGDPKSVFNFKIYNKTKELTETHDKPYIRAKWQKKLLNYDTEKKDVWRLEVSIKDWKKIKLEDTQLIEKTNDVYYLLDYYIVFFYVFLKHKFIFKDQDGKEIEFLPKDDNFYLYENITSNIANTDEVITPYLTIQNIIKSSVKLIEKASDYNSANEYITKLEMLIQDPIYYQIFKDNYLDINILYSYISFKFNPEKFAP